MREKIREFIRREPRLLVALLIAVIYFFSMLKYYQLDYFAPDFRLYAVNAVNGQPAFTGFSSLFMLLAGLGTFIPEALHFFCLALIAVSIYNILAFYDRVFAPTNRNFAIFIAIMMSCCVWYYFYGKLFYEWPFTIYTYSICLMLLGKALINGRAGLNTQMPWLLFAAAMGLTLSWKPYNIFLVAGLGLLILCNDETRGLFFSRVHSVKSFLSCLVLFAAGYIAGNFNLLLRPQETLGGLLAYPAKSGLAYFFLTRNSLAWDHVNLLPFHLAVMSLGTMFLILAVLPILAKKFRYLAVSSFLFLMLCIYIKRFSPGYPWHGFPFGGFIITFAMFLLHEGFSLRRAAKFVISTALILQFFSAFVVYIPTQAKWHNATQRAIDILEKHENDIYEGTMQLIEEIGDSTFFIECAVKRFYPISYFRTAYHWPSIENPYIFRTATTFADPLYKTDFWTWKRVELFEGYKTNEFEYVIFIMPDAFTTMSDVANIYLYQDNPNFEAVNRIHGEGFQLLLYRRVVQDQS